MTHSNTSIKLTFKRSIKHFGCLGRQLLKNYSKYSMKSIFELDAISALISSRSLMMMYSSLSQFIYCLINCPPAFLAWFWVGLFFPPKAIKAKHGAPKNMLIAILCMLRKGTLGRFLFQAPYAENDSLFITHSPNFDHF